MEASQALREVHFPSADADLEALNHWSSEAHRRLVFEEFFLLELGLALRQRDTTVEERRIAYRGTGALADQLRSQLPFKLTMAQERVLAEIMANMRRPHPMNRLLQGDVGSGKTIVALAGDAGGHRKRLPGSDHGANGDPCRATLSDHASSSGTAWGASDAVDERHQGQQRRELLETIAAGDVDLLVGTHALIQEGLEFRALGLAVIDEQHRFGVLQRATLKRKGYSPDVLVMTATPIPRTLAMTVYGDLEVSIIDELPPGRLPVITKLCYESRRDEL